MMSEPMHLERLLDMLDPSRKAARDERRKQAMRALRMRYLPSQDSAA